MRDRHHVRVRVDVVLIHANGKETVVQQLWRDVPISDGKKVKENAPGCCVDAIACLLGESKCCRCDDD